MTGVALFSFVLFTVLVAVISWFVTRKDNLSTNTGYFLASRSLSGVVIAGSLILTNLSAEQLVGTNGLGFKTGLSCMSWEATSGITLVFMALIFLPRYLKGGFTTVPDFLEERFDEGTRNLVTALFLLSLAFVTLPIVLYAGGIALNSLFNVSALLHMDPMSSLKVVITLIGIVGGIYAIFGGLKAVAVSDTINGIGLIIGGTMIPVLGLIVLGDGNLLHGFSKLIVSSPERMDALGSAKLPGTAPLGTLFTGMVLVNTFYWCTNQQIVQRTFAAKNLEQGQKGVLLAGFIKIFTPIILVVPGIIAYQLYGSEITTIDSAYSVLVSHVLPKPLIGFFGAVMFGAVLSSFNSALNSAATMFCVNVYKPIIDKKVSDEKLIFIGKIFGLVIGLFSIIVAPQIAKAPNGLYTFMKSVMGFFNIPVLVVVLMGFATKKVPAIGAKIAIYFFIIFYALQKFVVKFPIHFLYVYAILFFCCVVIMLIAGKIAPMEKAYHQKDVGEVDLQSWNKAKPVSFVIVTTTIWIYILFSRFGIVFHGENFGGRFMVVSSIYAIISVVGYRYIAKHHNTDFAEEKSQLVSD